MNVMTETLIRITDKLSCGGKRLIIAIDGRCASGKTTLAKEISKSIDCNVFHTDDFFLRPCQRTEERFAEAGGNVDYERFFEEVLTPVINHEDFSFCPFDCSKMKLSEPVFIKDKKINIIEGAYSCHPYFGDCYNLRIFLTTSHEMQIKRIKLRNGEEALEMFSGRWIPFEENYFQKFNIISCCDMIFET